jgi:hypothetical protein
MTYPDDCLQSSISSDWWLKDQATNVHRGALVFAFAPHVDQVPYTFEPIGRTSAEEHETAAIRVTPLAIKAPRRRTELPVAAMSLHDGELWAAYKAKKRPCLVLGELSPIVDKSLIRGKPKRSIAPTILCAPYYGATGGVKRAGYNEEFIERVRHCEYPQFLWDVLPHDRGEESILRLDHLQPIGTHYNSYQMSGFKLCADALEIMDDLVTWLMRGGVSDGGRVAAYRELVEEIFS